jgi:hypothetical protein
LISRIMRTLELHQQTQWLVGNTFDFSNCKLGSDQAYLLFNKTQLLHPKISEWPKVHRSMKRFSFAKR